MTLNLKTRDLNYISLCVEDVHMNAVSYCTQRQFTLTFEEVSTGAYSPTLATLMVISRNARIIAGGVFA